jgi:hypothetical protein
MADEEYYDDEFETQDNFPTFQPGIDAASRIGPSGIFLGTIIGGDAGDLQSQINKMNQDPVERFKLYVDAISRNLTSLELINLTQDDIDNMLSPIKKIKNINHKNPTAYVLGYIASNGGTNISQKQVTYVLNKILPNIANKLDIKQPDVIRYARYWMTLG